MDKNTHRFTVTTGRGDVTEIAVTGTPKQARAKLAMKLMRYRTRIAPDYVTSVAVSDAG